MLDSLIATATHQLGVIFFFLMAAVLWAFLNYAKDKVKIPKRVTLERRVQADEFVYGILEQLKTSVSAERAYVFQFHSNSNFLSGKQLMYMTCTHSAGCYDSGKVEDHLIHRHTSFLSPLLREEVYVIRDVERMPDEDARKLIAHPNTKSIVLVTFGKKQVEGFIGLDFIFAEAPEDMKMVKQYVNRIGDTLRRGYIA